MSRVTLIAADKPLPLCDRREERVKVITLSGGEEMTIEYLQGFQVDDHVYYLHATQSLGLPMKFYQYELSLEPCEQDLESLRSYLHKNLSPGDRAELWSLQLGDPDPEFLDDTLPLDALDVYQLYRLCFLDGIRVTLII